MVFINVNGFSQFLIFFSVLHCETLHNIYHLFNFLVNCWSMLLEIIVNYSPQQSKCELGKKKNVRKTWWIQLFFCFPPFIFLRSMESISGLCRALYGVMLFLLNGDVLCIQQSDVDTQEKNRLIIVFNSYVFVIF